VGEAVGLELEQLDDLLADGALGQFFTPGLSPECGAGEEAGMGQVVAAEEQVVEDRQGGKERQVLKAAGDAALGERDRPLAGDVLAAEADGSTGGAVDAVQAVEIEVLPAPLGPVTANSCRAGRRGHRRGR
jgi:hypothetical protein